MQLIAFLFLYCALGFSQDNDYSEVDATAIFYPQNFEDTQALSSKIKEDFSDQAHQLRAAYTWVIHNIAYEPEEYLKFLFQYRILEERNEKLASTREAIINRTITEKKAVCEGYALTLERICEELGINAYVVRGDVKRDVTDIGRAFDKNHMWIIAIVNQKPVIMDPTWGAGKYVDRFYREPSYAFYDVQPDHFLKTHYPEVFDDAYVTQVVSKSTFASWPLIISPELDLADVSPTIGALKYKNLKNGLDFNLSIKPEGKLLYTFDDGVMREIDGSQNGDTHTFTLRASSRTTRLVIFDGDKPLVAYLVK